MKEETRKLLEKAARAIEAAKTLLKTGILEKKARSYLLAFNWKRWLKTNGTLL